MFRRRSLEKLGFVIYFFGISVIAIGMVQGQFGAKKFVDMKNNHDILKKRVDELKDKEKRLATEIKRIKNSKEYATKVWKEKYRQPESGEVLETY